MPALVGYRNPSEILVRLDLEDGVSALRPKDGSSLPGQANFLDCCTLKMEAIGSAEMWVTYQ
jgi:hypothetical protein